METRIQFISVDLY